MQALPDTEWTSADLLGRLERRDRFFVLDVRNRDEFEKFRLEGHSPPPPVNVPDHAPVRDGGWVRPRLRLGGRLPKPGQKSLVELVGQETEPMDGASVYAHYVKRVT